MDTSIFVKGAFNNVPFLCQLFFFLTTSGRSDGQFIHNLMLNTPFFLLNTSCPLAKHLNHPSHFGRKLFWKKNNKGYSNIKPIKIALYIYTYFGEIFFIFGEKYFKMEAFLGYYSCSFIT